MLKSFISLKPSSSLGYFKFGPQRSRRTINFICQAIDVLFNILDFLELDEILIIHSIYKKTKKARQIQNKIVFYLIKTERLYSYNQQKNFIMYLTRKYTIFNLKQYNKENVTWKQPINLDIQRTNITNLKSRSHSQRQLPDRTIQLKKDEPYKLQHKKQIINNKIKPNFLSVKFNFLMFTYPDSQSKKLQFDRKLQINFNFKNYLKTVLNAISNRNKTLGYVQGLNFWIKHMFQTKLTEQQAFSYACYLLQNMNVQTFFKQQMQKVSQLCYVFDVYLFNNLPSLYYLLKSCEVSPTIYASNWFITLFSEQLSKRVINKIWHLFILKGQKILIKFGISVMFTFQAQIKKVPKDQIFFYMRKILQNIDKDKQRNIWAIMNSIKVSNKMIAYLCKQMRNLYNDTEIQLWRLQHQSWMLQKQKKINSKRNSLSCRPSIQKLGSNSGYKKLYRLNKYCEQQNDGNGCCSSYIHSKMKTQSTQDNYSILSLCRSVNYQ